MNILITAINSSTALNIIKYLRKQTKYSIKIVGCDVVEYTAGLLFVDKFYIIPKAQEVMSALLDICKAEQIDIIIPVFEPELAILSENREMFLPTKIILPSKDVVKLCLNKEATLNFFLQNNIPTCQLYDLTNYKLPLFLKPKVGNSSQGTKTINTIEALCHCYNPKRDIICELLVGEEFTIDLYCAKPGKINCILARKRIETTDGMATKAITISNDKMFDYCKKIVQLLNYEGVACIQCICDKDFRFFEINPRFGGSTNLTLEAGYNIPLYILDTFCNASIQLPENIRNLYMVKYYENIYWEVQ